MYALLHGVGLPVILQRLWRRVCIHESSLARGETNDGRLQSDRPHLTAEFLLCLALRAQRIAE